MVEFCDGWMPLATRHDIVDQVSRVRAAVADAGRDPAAFEITAYAARLGNVNTMEEAGVDRAVFSLPPLGADEVIPRMQRYAAEVGLKPS
jgi:alkanesulfonate monooxygenase SsuD/methylene tetrahydromethanopterin reductase-like flavin-dependent oxidoreductase (luciferase family)